MYAIIIAVAFGQFPTTEKIESSDWVYKNQNHFMKIQMKKFGKHSGLKNISFLSAVAGRDISGRPYFKIKHLTGFYSVEEKRDETLIHSRFGRLSTIRQNRGKGSGTEKIDYIVVFHTKLTDTGDLEVYYTSDHVKNLVGWSVNRKYLFKKDRQKMVSK